MNQDLTPTQRATFDRLVADVVTSIAAESHRSATAFEEMGRELDAHMRAVAARFGAPTGPPWHPWDVPPVEAFADAVLFDTARAAGITADLPTPDPDVLAWVRTGQRPTYGTPRMALLTNNQEAQP